MTAMTSVRQMGIGCALALAAVLVPRPAAAQLDPLLFLKKTQPNVLIAIDTSNRMQRDLDNNYRDNNVYAKTGALYEVPLGVTGGNTTAKYRRKYVNLLNTDTGLGTDDKFTADRITIVGDLDASYSTFDALTRINLAKLSVVEAITRNSGVARFGLLRMRQSNPHFDGGGNIEPVKVSEATQDSPTDGSSGSAGKWKITRPAVDGRNGSTGTSGLLYKADASANSSILSTLGLATGASGSLIPAGSDAKNYVDAPIDLMLDDLKTEAKRLIDADLDCRNTIAVLIVGGGRGDSSTGDPASKASAFLNVSNGHRVPIYVVLLASTVTTDAERTQLKAVAANSGGQFFEVTSTDVDVVSAGVAVPKIVQAINTAVANAFVDQGSFDKAPDASHPYGYSTEHQVTSPIIGTVNLENAKDITGANLPDTVITTKTGELIPQRSNVLVTAGFSLPDVTGSLRAFRVYKPVVDDTKPSGYQFKADGTRLWVASVPDEASRNIYTATPDGTIIKFSTANAATLQPYLRASSVAAAQSLITFVRSQPLGAIVDSTPAMMDPPSLDPPPDSDYPGFADKHKARRGMIWVGANDGMLHGIDGRLGKEVWAFIPFNLLPKLETLRSGQPLGDFRFFVDGSPKVADVKVEGFWHTYLVMGEGPGGTFYQTFDVSMDDQNLDPAGDNLSDVLAYFSNEKSITLQWAFPKYSSFDWNCTSTGDCPNSKWGDLSKTATSVEKTVGQTWSDPAIGQVESTSGRFTVLTGSGFFRYARQQDPNRGGIVAGSSLYLLDVKDGSVLDYKDVGNDKKGETVDDCTTAPKGCTELKNALQADVVATGPADSRFITKAYLGDLDGKIWRFDVGLDASKVPKIKQLVSLYSINPAGGGTAADHPVFASMATVNVGGAQQYLFVGTGSDLLPSTNVSNAYALLVVLDQGTTGSKVAEVDLEKTDGLAGDEKVSAFPAVAGDIVFFSTTTYRVGGCVVPDANLYAFTFIGGPAYDTNGDGRVTSGKAGSDSTKVRTSAGARASAPFIVDQHVVFAAGNKLEMFGDPTDFNNGVGQAGVRILSWREVR